MFCSEFLECRDLSICSPHVLFTPVSSAASRVPGTYQGFNQYLINDYMKFAKVSY